MRILLLLCLAFLIFSCFRKKKPAPNLADWLEKNFPNRFKIVDTQTEDVFRNLTFQKKKSVVADRADSLLQIQIRYDLRDADLGIAAAEIDELVAAAKPDLAASRDLFLVLENAGFQKVSASIRHGEAVVLFFENPTSELRKQVLKDLKTAFSGWSAAKNYGLSVVFMEPAVFQTEFSDIVPLAHWVRADSWQSRKTVVSLRVGEGYVFDKKLEKEWQFNTDSDKFSEVLARARPIFQSWAEAHFHRKLVMQPISEIAPLGEKLGAWMKFSFAENSDENSPVVCRVAGEFLLDEDAFQNLKIAEE